MFRGSATLTDWVTNIKSIKAKSGDVKHALGEDTGVHRGFSSESLRQDAYYS